MLLSAGRSTLLTAANPEDPTEEQSLLSAAAERLHVPRSTAEGFAAAAALEQGRDQVVSTSLARPEIEDALRERLHLFLVLDCLPAAERPTVEALAGQGITAVTAEMVVFEWLERADSDDFRSMLQLIR